MKTTIQYYYYFLSLTTRVDNTLQWCHHPVHCVGPIRTMYNVQCTRIDRKPPFINYQFHYLEMKKFQNKILAGEMELSTIMKMAEFVIVMMITYYCNEQKNELTWSALPMGTVRWSHPQLLSRDHQKIIGTCLHSL